MYSHTDLLLGVGRDFYDYRIRSVWTIKKEKIT